MPTSSTSRINSAIRGGTKTSSTTSTPIKGRVGRAASIHWSGLSLYVHTDNRHNAGEGNQRQYQRKRRRSWRLSTKNMLPYLYFGSNVSPSLNVYKILVLELRNDPMPCPRFKLNLRPQHQTLRHEVPPLRLEPGSTQFGCLL